MVWDRKKGSVYRKTLICYAGNRQYKFFLNWLGVFLYANLEYAPVQTEVRDGT